MELGNDISVLQYIVTMGGYFALLMGIVAVMRRKVIFSHYFWIGSLLTFPLWLMGGVEGWFRWMKILSVILPTIIVGFSRGANNLKKEGPIWNLFKKNWIYYFFFCILFLNIAEATAKDFALGNYFNAFAGLVLCVTIPLPLKYWTVSKDKYGDLITYTTIGWNLLYTTWNACFVYGESPNYFASSVCILMAAEMYPIIKRKPELYLSARIYTLATHLIIRACLPGIFLNLMDSSRWFNQTALEVWGIGNAVIAVPYLVWYVVKLKNGEYKQELVERYA